MLRNSRLGIAMRATSSDQETALGLGIPVGKVFAVTWFIAGAFAALAGILSASANQVSTLAQPGSSPSAPFPPSFWEAWNLQPAR